MNQTFIIFDTETTGLDVRSGDKIIEIAALKVHDGKEVEGGRFEMFVNPERDIPFEAQQVNNITLDMVKDAPKIQEVLPEFLAFVGDFPLVAHNAEFDVGFLEEEMFMQNPFARLPTVLCTKKLSRALAPKEKFHNLDTLSYRYNISLPTDRHRAMADVELLALVFEKMLEAGNITTFADLCAKAQIR
ncbi:hypothetical protein COW46_04905 [Candidatus Gracilibacteria bacterium CG17_big_fil_post_rev_8_21_14_2_50_48_13]|nr:MAG: hypothetical protein COW46_04905 [Candidatus Gracilibacteria bacterium CG17_big_fil_post_rev_8_21_14_2_50_48_13]